MKVREICYIATVIVAVLSLLLFHGAVHAVDWPAPFNETKECTRPFPYTKDLMSLNPAIGVFWYCKEKFQWRGTFFSGYAKDFDPDWREQLNTALLLKDPTPIFSSWLTRVHYSCKAPPNEEAAALCAEVSKELQASFPLPPKFQTPASYASDLKRPMYPVVNGVRVTKVAPERAPQLTECRCTHLGIVESTSSVYCEVKDMPDNLVSLCREVK